MSDEARARLLRDRLADRLKHVASVHGVGLGGRRAGNEPTGEPCLTVFVERKLPVSVLSDADLIPTGFGDLRTDVVAVPRPHSLACDPIAGSKKVSNRLGWRFHADNARYPFLCGGIQIMSRIRRPGQGTLGCLLHDRNDPAAIYALTNYHVLEGARAPDAETRVGHPTAQNSVCGCCSHQFGTYAGGLVPGTGSHGTSRFDLAVARLDPGTQWAGLITQIGYVRGVHTVTWSEVQDGDYQVRKRGITTGLTGGTILAVGFLTTDPSRFLTHPDINSNDVVIEPNPNPYDLEQPVHFGLEGDSGSAVVNCDNEVVALLWGGMWEDPGPPEAPTDFPIPPGVGYATPIEASLDRLRTETGLDLVVAQVDGTGEVQTVPGAPAPPIPTDLTRAVTDDNPERAARRLGRDLAASSAGRDLADFWLRNQEELLLLVNNNRRVATAWNRSGAAEVFRAAIRSLSHDDSALPDRVDGRDVADVLGTFARALEPHATQGLLEGMARVRPLLGSLGGLTYREAVERLEQVS